MPGGRKTTSYNSRSTCMKRRTQASSQQLAKKMLGLLYIFVGAAIMCVPLYIGMVASAILTAYAYWLAWSAIEALWYLLLAFHLLHVFNPKVSPQVVPLSPVSSPSLLVGRVSSFVPGLGSSVWNLFPSLVRLDTMDPSVVRFTGQKKSGRLKNKADIGASGLESLSEHTTSVQGVDRASAASRPKSTAKSSEGDEFDRKAAERALKRTFGSDTGSPFSPAPETYSASDTPLAGSSTQLTGMGTGSVQSYLELKPLQQLLRAHSMREQNSSKNVQALPEEPTTAYGNALMKRIGTAPASAGVWAIDEHVTSVPSLTNDDNCTAPGSGVTSTVAISRSRSHSSASTAEHTMRGGASSPSRPGEPAVQHGGMLI